MHLHPVWGEMGIRLVALSSGHVDGLLLMSDVTTRQNALVMAFCRTIFVFNLRSCLTPEAYLLRNFVLQKTTATYL